LAYLRLISVLQTLHRRTPDLWLLHFSFFYRLAVYGTIKIIFRYNYISLLYLDPNLSDSELTRIKLFISSFPFIAIFSARVWCMLDELVILVGQHMRVTLAHTSA
jgi:hypothetical protein